MLGWFDEAEYDYGENAKAKDNSKERTFECWT